jgi:hypothetical protein
VHGYKKFIETVNWDEIKWGVPEESGAKSVRKEGNKTIYTF